MATAHIPITVTKALGSEIRADLPARLQFLDEFEMVGAPHKGKDGSLLGYFSMKVPRGKWITAGNAIRINDISYWEILYPMGILLKYPCGTKRFIKDTTLTEAIELTKPSWQ